MRQLQDATKPGKRRTVYYVTRSPLTEILVSQSKWIIQSAVCECKRIAWVGDVKLLV